MDETKDKPRPRSRARWIVAVLVIVFVLYPLSSGPVLATAFWLREATRIDAFYGVMWVYLPILKLPRSLWGPYVGWWVKLFGTVFPG